MLEYRQVLDLVMLGMHWLDEADEQDPGIRTHSALAVMRGLVEARIITESERLQLQRDYRFIGEAILLLQSTYVSRPPRRTETADLVAAYTGELPMMVFVTDDLLNQNLLFGSIRQLERGSYKMALTLAGKRYAQQLMASGQYAAILTEETFLRLWPRAMEKLSKAIVAAETTIGNRPRRQR